ncbi:T9SS type A sorting domain-containing protein [Lishizhenia sp.]|uniref:T9SS type A sorting domain-containing protein n=1 Tax=Lishizhenia sp. TaxID=2497594 RepID=UPI00299CD698|nr:T9SS type A sorting domain-containing protein [Lishizhenia sp.]MDX1445122.1 T9SS type A sorting domain-containing protein [Lishizhenia sp.]
MKTLITFVLTLPFIMSSHAQTQITANTLNPTIGATVKTKFEQTLPMNFEQNGTNAVWDLSQFFPSQEDSFSYINVAEAQSPSLAPNASFVKRYNSGELFVTLNDSAYVHEHYQPYQNSAFVYDYAVLFNLPMQYGNVDTNNYSGTLSLAGSTTLQEVESIHSVVGEGTLITSQTTFNNCIKTKVVRNFKDSSVETQSVYYSSDTTYFWFSPNYPDPLLSISIRYSSGSQQTFYYTALQQITSLSTTKNDISKLEVYPNPSNGIITLKELPKTGTIILTDPLGKTIVTFPVDKTTQQLDLRHLDKGSYFLHVAGKETTHTQQIMLQ